ncbi:MAG TPA: hypothetical protein VK077_03695 [Virgibacillus sp.]|nr:hypothetical protein [Virgibacillus sp.]
MSEKKKKQVIHVKDLIIKADNVYIERGGHHHRHDPFFGSRSGDDGVGGRKESQRRDDDRHDRKGDDRPFSWL